MYFSFTNPTCKLLKGAIVSRKIKCGVNNKFGEYSRISADVTLGDNINIGSYCTIRKIKIESNSTIESNVRIVGTGKGMITIGKESYIGLNNVLDTSNNIEIGSFVHIAGPSTVLWTHSSSQMCLNSIPLNDVNRDDYRSTAPIVIESNVYIGGNCTIYPGITIHNHSIVAPNSAVTKDVPPYTMVGGVPAKIIKEINGIKETH